MLAGLILEDRTGGSGENIMRWEVLYGLAAIERTADAWNDLAHASSLSPVADALWMRCWWRAFGKNDRSLAVHALYENDRLLAILPLQRRGRLIRTWKPAFDGNAPYSMFALDEGHPEVATEIVSHLLQDADEIELGPIHAKGPIYQAVRDAAQAQGLITAESDAGVDLVMKVFSPWEELKQTIPAKTRQETGRKKRQLERLGRLDLEIVTSGPALRPALDACYAIEARTWKRSAGSAVLLDPQDRQFFDELADCMGEAGRFALYLLKLDDRIIAYEYSLRAQGKIDSLKPSFEPELARYSPGNVLRWMILESEAGRGEVTSYGMGPPYAHKQHWTRLADPLCRLHVYKPRAMSKLACALGPKTRSLLKKSDALRAIKHRLREIGKSATARAIKRRLRALRQ
jgi:CelD/BcsL family acetyltransferase involved in cellulose biosynthesis